MQQSNRLRIFNKFTETVKIYITKETMEVFHSRYYIREFKIWEVDAAAASNIYLGILARTKRSQLQKNQLGWVQNELRIFVWTLVFYCYSKNIDIHRMTQEDWEFFVILFPSKKKILFQYQSNILLKNHNQYKKWLPEEDKMFQELVKKDEYKLKWSDLGKILFIESDREYFRTPKQCRQRWLNHLDPSKHEDFVLIEYVKYFGKKWANISKKLQSKRNQHSIKNRFKSLLNKQSKLYQQKLTQQQAVNNIYCKLLQSISKNSEDKQSNIKQPHEEVQQSSYINKVLFQEQKQQSGQIYDQDYQSIEVNALSHQILVNISLNSRLNQYQQTKMRTGIQKQKNAFQFKRVNHIQFSEDKNTKRNQFQDSQIEKRIRADLFLQQDPFQMLKSYFYKS